MQDHQQILEARVRALESAITQLAKDVAALAAVTEAMVAGLPECIEKIREHATRSQESFERVEKFCEIAKPAFTRRN